MSMEYEFTHWRLGQTVAERMVAKFLVKEGYRSVDPQAPRGGPDNKADILFDAEDDSLGVCACYFPHGVKEWSEIEEKFDDDAKGVERHKAGMFIFATGQLLTLAQRGKLKDRMPVTTRICDFEVLNAHLPQLLGDSGIGFEDGRMTDLDRQADAAALETLLQHCDFRGLELACGRGPRSFGASITKVDQLTWLEDRHHLAFRDKKLADHFAGWRWAWRYLLEILRTGHSLLPDESVVCDSREWLPGRVEPYFEQVSRRTRMFLQRHRAFLGHVKATHPDVLANPAAAFQDLGAF